MIVAPNTVRASLLEEARPRYIILYDAEPQLIRHVEVYQATHPEWQVRVYFLMYDRSVEKQNYVNTLKREKEAFERLIESKGSMVVPEDQDGKGAELPEALKPLGPIREDNSSSRKGGGIVKRDPGQVVVDVRELRSQLPFMLFQRGVTIHPLTLLVGDYVLTPSMCVERKSVPDLHQSLNSGRLFQQVESMLRHYDTPAILIEFHKDKPFVLQPRAEIGPEININNIISKLVLVTLHFPDIRIFWSASTHHTADIYESLKAKNPDPDPDVALSLGTDATDRGDNQAAQDMLKKLPGVNAHNVYNLCKGAKTLVALTKKTLKEITSLIGEANGKQLYNFLHCDTAEHLPAG